MRIETQVGKGTSVKVFLPRANVPPLSTLRIPDSSLVMPEPAQRRLLLVDDDSDVREVTAALLEDFGYEVCQAGSGGSALDLLEHEAPFDVMLLDFAMPGMNGVELSRQIEARVPGVPIVFITGYADTKAMGEIRKRHVVSKPFKPEQLASTLREALRGRRASS